MPSKMLTVPPSGARLNGKTPAKYCGGKSGKGTTVCRCRGNCGNQQFTEFTSRYNQPPFGPRYARPSGPCGLRFAPPLGESYAGQGRLRVSSSAIHAQRQGAFGWVALATPRRARLRSLSAPLGLRGLAPRAAADNSDVVPICQRAAPAVELHGSDEYGFPCPLPPAPLPFAPFGRCPAGGVMPPSVKASLLSGSPRSLRLRPLPRARMPPPRAHGLASVVARSRSLRGPLAPLRRPRARDGRRLGAPRPPSSLLAITSPSHNSHTSLTFFSPFSKKFVSLPPNINP